MKKLALVAFIYSNTLIALPVGNPTEPAFLTSGMIIHSFGCYDMLDPCFKISEGFNGRFGFAGDYVYNRSMEVRGEGTPFIQKTTLFTNAGYLALNFCNRFDLFTRLGVTNLAFEGNISAFPHLGLPEEYLAVDFTPEFSWSIGGRAVLWELGSFGIGVEGEYFRTTPDFNTITEGSGYLKTYPFDVSALYTEWQVALGAAIRFEVDCPDVALIPYASLSWSSAALSMNETIALNFDTVNFSEMQSQKSWGYCIGTTLTLFEMAAITVEGRFAAEKAFYVNGQLRF